MQPPSPKRFDHRLSEVLEVHNKAFIGEEHNASAMREALTYLMPSLKSQNVKTISFEVTQQVINNIIQAKSAEEWLAMPDTNVMPEEYKPKTLYDMVHAAQKYGIRVLGHEDPELDARYTKAYTEAAQEELPHQAATIGALMEKQKKASPAEQAEYLDEIGRIISSEIEKNPALAQKLDDACVDVDPESLSGLQARNQFSASYINEHEDKTGKTLICGGPMHSQYGCVMNKDIPKAEVTNKNLGLDSLLGIPAINLEATFYTPDTIGNTSPLYKTGVNETYEAILPPELKGFLHKHAINSWPPAREIRESPVYTNVKKEFVDKVR